MVCQYSRRGLVSSEKHEGTGKGQVVTNAVRCPVRPVTRWMRLLSMASAGVIAGRVVSRSKAAVRELIASA